MPLHLTAPMKSSVAKYMTRTGATQSEAMNLAGKGMLTSDGKRKFPGGSLPRNRKAMPHPVEVSREDKAAFDKRFPNAGVTLGCDDLGWYVMTHRSQSRRFKSIAAIPKSVVRQIESTG